MATTDLARIAPGWKGRSRDRRAAAGPTRANRPRLCYGEISKPEPESSTSPSHRPAHNVQHLRGENHPYSLTTRKIDGVYNSFPSNDLTVHLALDIQDDLDDNLEEFSRLCRVGDFTTASRFFAETLHSHLNNPYVLVHYAEMLLQRGEFKSIIRLDGSPLRHLDSQFADEEEGSTLKHYWELLRLLAESYRPGCSRERFHNVKGLIGDFFNRMTTPGREVSSTEIKLLVLILRLSRRPHIELDRHELRDEIRIYFDKFFYKRLYETLLRGGRVWDLYDLMSGMVHVQDIQDILHDIFGVTGVRVCLRVLVSDWENLGPGAYDTCTSLALLEIFALFAFVALDSTEAHEAVASDILGESIPLAYSIMQNDPESMKSRPYLRWILAKAQLAYRQGPNPVESMLLDNLQKSGGVVYHPSHLALPQYVPVNSENPGWKMEDAGPEITNPVNLVLRAAKAAEDYQTQSLALQSLIIMKSKPAGEFEALCNVKVAQGDMSGYIEILVSKYLISDSPDSKIKLKEEISEQAFAAGAGEYLSTDVSWVVYMLLYDLERKDNRTRALEAADHYYDLVHTKLAQEIARKMPDLQFQVELRERLKLRAVEDIATHPEAYHELQGEEHRVTDDVTTRHERTELDVRNSDAESHEGGSDGSNDISEDFNLSVRPSLLDGKKVTITFESINDPNDRHEVTYQPAVGAESFTVTQGMGNELLTHEQSSLHPQMANRINLKYLRDGASTEKKATYSVPNYRQKIPSDRNPDDSEEAESGSKSDSSMDSILLFGPSHYEEEKESHHSPFSDGRKLLTASDFRPQDASAKRNNHYKRALTFISHDYENVLNDLDKSERSSHHIGSFYSSNPPQVGTAVLENEDKELEAKVRNPKTKQGKKTKFRPRNSDKSSDESEGFGLRNFSSRNNTDYDRLIKVDTANVTDDGRTVTKPLYDTRRRQQRKEKRTENILPVLPVDGQGGSLAPHVAGNTVPELEDGHHDSVHRGCPRTRLNTATLESPDSLMGEKERTNEATTRTASPPRQTITSAANTEHPHAQPGVQKFAEFEQPERDPHTSDFDKGTASAHTNNTHKKAKWKRSKPAEKTESARGVSDLGTTKSEKLDGVEPVPPTTVRWISRDPDPNPTPNETIQVITRKTTYPTVESVEDFAEKPGADEERL